jgi:competence protein ComGF
MILETFIIILGLLVVILGYTTFNLLRKNEQAEDILISYQEFINKLQEHITKSETRLKEIDRKETFKSDDEIGWFFNEIKKIQNNLSQFKNNL